MSIHATAPTPSTAIAGASRPPSAENAELVKKDDSSHPTQKNVVPTVAVLPLIATVAAAVWIRLRQSRLFQKEIRPMLIWQFRKNGLDAYAFLSEIRRHRELRPLTSELWRWIDD